MKLTKPIRTGTVVNRTNTEKWSVLYHTATGFVVKVEPLKPTNTTKPPLITRRITFKEMATLLSPKQKA